MNVIPKDRSAFGSFAKAIFRKWWAALGSAALTIVGLYALIAQKSAAWLISAELLAAMLLFFYAAWDAWKEEHGKRIAAEKQLAQPQRTAAEQHDYERLENALKKLGDAGLVALRHIRTVRTITFGGPYVPTLPSRLTVDKALWVYRHCASEALLTHKSSLGMTEETFSVPQKLDKVFDDVLFQDSTSGG